MNDNTYLKIGDTIVLKDTQPTHKEAVVGLSIRNSGTRERISWNSVNYEQVRVALKDGTEVGGDEVLRW